MLKRDNAIQALIANGYNDKLVTELPKLFLEDYFESSKERMSEAIDIFIDLVQRGDIIPDENNNVRICYIEQMKSWDFEPKPINGLFYNFKSHMVEEFINIVKRRPLRNILMSHGVLEFNDGYQRFNREIIGSPEEYRDLYLVHIPCIYSCPSIYIMKSDLLALFESKGLCNESIGILEEFSRLGIFVNYADVMKLGNQEKAAKLARQQSL